MKNLPIRIQRFSDLMTQNYLYVDKTKEIHNLFAQLNGKFVNTIVPLSIIVLIFYL